MLLLSMTVGAQTRALGENQEYLVLDGSTTLTGEDENNAMYVEYFGDNWKIEAAFAKFDKELLKKYVSYKIVGVSVAGAFVPKEVPCFIKTAADSKTPATTLAETTLSNPTPSVLALKMLNWNDAMFGEAYTIPTADEIQDIYAGYSLLDADGNMKTKQILVGEPISDNENDPGNYIQQNGKISSCGHNVLNVKLILEKPASTGGDTPEGDKEYLTAHGKTSDTTGDATKIQGYDEYYDFYHNSYGMDFDAVFARFTTDDLEQYIGYKVVGLSVAGEFGQSNVDFMLNIQCNQTFNDKVQMSSKNVAIAKQAKATPSVNGMKLYNWNDIMFDTPYTIPAKKEDATDGDPDNFQDLYAGYWIKNADGKMVMDQLLVGQNYSDNEQDAGTYVQQTGASTKVPRIAGMFPGLLPVKLILEKGSSTGISGTETKADAKEVARYSLNGTRIYVPVRGINIIKMSDGTTRKVMVIK